MLCVCDKLAACTDDAAQSLLSSHGVWWNILGGRYTFLSVERSELDRN